MSSTDIHIGAPVRSSDGKHIGDVDRLVIDGETNRLIALVIDKGIFTDGRLVDLALVTQSDAKGLTLSVTVADAKSLPNYVEREFIQLRDAQVFTGGFGSFQASGADQWTLVGQGGGGISQTGSGSLFMSSAVGDMATQTMSNLTESDFMIGEGTKVIDVNGKTIGHISDILTNEKGDITGYAVKTGHLLHHSFNISANVVAGVSHDHVRLSVSEETAKTSGDGGSN
jgi:uncharacterized protein YrrD